MAWYMTREQYFGREVGVGNMTVRVGANGRLSPQPGLEDMAAIQSMRTLPHFAFRDEGEGEDAVENSAKAKPAEPTKQPEGAAGTPAQKAVKTKAATKPAKDVK